MGSCCLMKQEITVGEATFIINSFFSETAKQTADDLLRRVIVQKAEIEAKKYPVTGEERSIEITDNFQPKCID